MPIIDSGPGADAAVDRGGQPDASDSRISSCRLPLPVQIPLIPNQSRLIQQHQVLVFSAVSHAYMIKRLNENDCR